MLTFGSSGLFGGGSTAGAEHSMLSPDQMSPSLRDWLVSGQVATANCGPLDRLHQRWHE